MFCKIIIISHKSSIFKPSTDFVVNPLMMIDSIATRAFRRRLGGGRAMLCMIVRVEILRRRWSIRKRFLVIWNANLTRHTVQMCEHGTSITLAILFAILLVDTFGLLHSVLPDPVDISLISLLQRLPFSSCKLIFCRSKFWSPQPPVDDYSLPSTIPVVRPPMSVVKYIFFWKHNYPSVCMRVPGKHDSHLHL